MTEPRCTMTTEGPDAWARAKFHDGKCPRKGVEEVDGSLYCKQHAKAMKRFSKIEFIDGRAVKVPREKP